MSYNPSPETAAILDRALAYVQSVPYAVTARWVFYRLLQDGYLSVKSDYKRLLGYLSKARKEFYGEWRPDTLADDTRAAVVRGDGFLTGQDWIDALAKQTRCHRDRWRTQLRYVEVWFEAAAMTSQFQFHSNENIPLLAFHGDVSIPEKWKAATRLVERWRGARKPIYILYYGDFDKKGLEIPLSAERDLRLFMAVDLMVKMLRAGASKASSQVESLQMRSAMVFRRVGINEEHIAQYNLPENPERPGTYQWEGVPDDAAQELIGEANDLLNLAAFGVEEVREDEITRQFRTHLDGLHIVEPK